MTKNRTFIVLAATLSLFSTTTRPINYKILTGSIASAIIFYWGIKQKLPHNPLVHTLVPEKQQTSTQQPHNIKDAAKLLQCHPNNSHIPVRINSTPQQTGNLYKKIPLLPGTAPVVVLSAHGFDPICGTNGLKHTYRRLKHKNFTCPCVTFNFDDRHTRVNFGQKADVDRLQEVYDQLIQKNPQARVILNGECRGALAALLFAARNPKNIVAIILESPVI